MAIHPLLQGIVVNGEVALRCRDCHTPPAETIAENILIVCPTCGQPLGEWDSQEARAAELEQFKATVLHHVPVKKTPPRKRQSKNESKSRNMSYGRGGGGSKKNRKRNRKGGSK
ncbi:MAG TPA: hypothetical protein VE077_05685 [Candidatus Methylomirabilis sp.]|nr:hypothetical protein [Candidatus Methylomirabilis sp.]